ncbi:MAG: 16S rRNA (uracil(1498)-N(3))-methyltransferase [Deltaproteobacteria bacterium]|jgi:16S rRNA (uracil1498-N3)-methyltransferase|nr:16S rRNA (uracil(1498)-N(3))-methyltransferase [Deltaproteobacteria bacterium]
MRRFFVDPENITGSTAILIDQEAHHVAKVLRLKTGTTITLFDGSGSYYEALLTKISPGLIETKIVAITPYIDTGDESRPTLHLAMGLLKGKKMDIVIQKTTELGVDTLHSFYSRYCAVKEHSDKRLSRWEKIALEACKQSNRPKPPSITPPQDFDSLLAVSGNDKHDLRLIFWENQTGQKSIREIFTQVEKIHSIMIIIGPEGGFSPDEVDRAVDAGFEPVTMGTRILRAETAAIAAVSVIQHELGNLA